MGVRKKKAEKADGTQGRKPATVTRLADEAVARAEKAARAAEAARAAADAAVQSLQEAPVVVVAPRRGPLPVSGEAGGVRVDSSAEGVVVTIGKESAVLDFGESVVVRRKIEQAAARL